MQLSSLHKLDTNNLTNNNNMTMNFFYIDFANIIFAIFTYYNKVILYIDYFKYITLYNFIANAQIIVLRSKLLSKTQKKSIINHPGLIVLYYLVLYKLMILSYWGICLVDLNDFIVIYLQDFEFNMDNFIGNHEWEKDDNCLNTGSRRTKSILNRLGGTGTPQGGGPSGGGRDPNYDWIYANRDNDDIKKFRKYDYLEGNKLKPKRCPNKIKELCGDNVIDNVKINNNNNDNVNNKIITNNSVSTSDNGNITKISVRFYNKNTVSPPLPTYKNSNMNSQWYQVPELVHRKEFVNLTNVDGILPEGRVFHGIARAYYESNLFYVYFPGTDDFKTNSFCVVVHPYGNTQVLTESAEIFAHIANQQYKIISGYTPVINPIYNASNAYETCVRHHIFNEGSVKVKSIETPVKRITVKSLIN